MRKDVVKCPECERITPKRHPKCVYCAAVFRTSAAVEDIFEPRTLGGKKRFTRQSDDRGHYLVLSSGQPMEIAEGKRFVMGRDPRASLVLHAEDVSRQHAEITWEGEPPLPQLNEVRSRNGTLLNGKPVVARNPQPMRSGDEIGLGGQIRIQYLHVTERDLRLHMEDRSKSDTRAMARTAGGPPPSGDVRVLGDLVAAALGEADLAPLEEAGDFQVVSGNVLVKRLYSEQRSGVLTVYDGTAVGELHLIDGRCQHAILGVLSGRDALRHVASLDSGQFRFLPEDPDVLAQEPAPGEVDAEGIALSGDLSVTPGSVLLRDFVARKATGTLTLFSGGETGFLVLENGISRDVMFGGVREREGLEAIVRLGVGAFRFRPAFAAAQPLLDPSAWEETLPYEDRSSTKLPRSALRGVAGEDSVRRRSGTPMRPPPPSGPLTRRQRPPLPKRRNPPPRPH